MKYMSEYRDPELAKQYLEEIKNTVTQPWSIMEVCGGQTHSLVKNGIILIDDCYPEEHDAYEQYKGVTKAINELIINSGEYTDIEWEKDMGVLRAKKV